MANQITRDIYVLRKSIIEPIHYVRLTNAVDIVFNMRDYDIPSGAVAAVYAQKPDGTAVYSNATISENTVTVEMTTQMVAVLGVGHLQVRIQSGSNSSDVLCSFVVPLIVEPNFTEGDFPPSQNENGFFGDVEEHLQQVESEMTTMKEQWTEFQENINEQVQEIREEQTEQADEITDLQKKVAKLDEEKSPALVLDASGSWVTVEDSGNSAANGLTIHGKSTQVVTTGAQLVDWELLSSDSGSFTKTDENYTLKQVSAKNTTRSFVKLQKYDGETSVEIGIVSSLGDNKTIVFTKDSTFKKIMFGFNGDKVDTLIEADVSSMIDGEKYTISFNFNSDEINAGEIDKIILSKGDTWHDFEPYTGGAPSPSPDYPQEITSVGDSGSIEVVSTGKNLFDKDTEIYSQFGGTSATPTDTGITVTGPWFVAYELSLPQNANIYVSFQASGNTRQIAFYKNKSFLETNRIVTIGSNGQGMFNTEDFEGIIALFYAGTGTSGTTTYTNVMFNRGTAALPWEPYVSSTATFSTPNGLPGIPVDSGGNYTDEDGQQWICDEIDTKTGAYIRRVGKITFDGSSDEAWYENNAQGIVYITLGDAMPSQNVICNYFESYEFVSGAGYKEGVTLNPSKVLCFYIANMDSISNVQTWKTWLSTHPVTLIYPLATPVETPLSDAELISAGDFRTFATVTNATTEDPVEPEITLEYAADLKTYIDKKLAEISAATLENATNASQ